MGFGSNSSQMPGLCNDYTMVCPAVRQDNSRALASRLSPVQAVKL